MLTLPPTLLLLATLHSGVARATIDNPSLEDCYQRARSTHSVSMDEELEWEVELGEGVRLDCASNAAGVASVVLTFAQDGQLWVSARDLEGYALRHSSTLHRKVDSLIYQLGATPLAVHAQWTWAGDRATVRSRVSQDKVFNAQRLEWAHGRTDVGEEGKGTALQISSASCLKVPMISVDERIAGLSHLWSEIRYNFAFFDQVPDLDWDAALLESLPTVRNAQTMEDYYAALQRMVAQLNDGHTGVWGPGIRNRDDAHLPFTIAFDTQRRPRVGGVTDRSAIRSPEDRAALQEADLEVGQILTHWQGQPIEHFLNELVRPTISASTPQSSDLIAARRLTGGDYGSTVTFGFLTRDGQARQATLRRSRCPLPSRRASSFAIQELDDGVLHINLPSFSSPAGLDMIRREWPRILDARGLIFDVRQNGGGNSNHGWSIVSYLTLEPIPRTAWKTRKYLPAYQAWGRPEGWHEGDLGTIAPRDDAYLGPVCVLIGPETFSAAEDFVAVLHASERATIVGRPSGGSTGQPLQIELPGPGGARVCTKRDTYPDGRDFVGVGIQPDVIVDPFDDLDTPDPELERALAIILGEGDAGEASVRDRR